MRRPSLACLAALVLVASSASAQPPPAAKPPAAPMGPPPSPMNVEVNDPLLAPMPPPTHVLTNWREVLTQIKGRSADVIIATAEIERSRGLWRQALAVALPSIIATGTVTGQIIKPAASTETIGGATVTIPNTTPNPLLLAQLTASMPIFALQTWYNIGTADRQIKASALLAEDKERVVLGATADAIVAVVTAERVAEVNRVNLRSTLQTLELTQRKQRLGSGTQLDVVQAAGAVSTARGTLITGDEQLRKAREALGIALGYNDDWGVTQGISLDQIGDTLKTICSPAKADDRTDVLAAKQAVLVAERGVTGSYLAYAPTASISTTLQASNGLLVDGRKEAWSIGGLLSWTIWEGGARYGTTRIAKVQETENKATLDITLRQARVQTTQAIRNVEVSTASREVATQTRDLTKEQAHLQQVAFEAGTGTSFDLVTSQAQARQAELQLAVAEFAVVQAKIEAMLAAANCKF